MPQFYTYLHCKPDGTPFYVGKGTVLRAHELKRHRNRHHQNVIAQYDKEQIGIYLFPCESELQAYSDEEHHIKQLRLEGVKLCNKSDGGEGSRNPSLETREKLSSAAKTQWQNPVIRKKMKWVPTTEQRARASLRAMGNKNSVGQKLSPERKAALRKFHLGRKASLATRMKLSIAHMGQKSVSGMKGKKHSPLTIIKMRIAQKTRRQKERGI